MKRCLSIMIVFVIVSCAPQSFTPVEKTIYTTTKTLAAAKQFRHTGLQIAGDFYRRGLIEEDVKEEIIEVANELQMAINVTADVLQIYLISKGQEEAQMLETKILLYQQLYGKFSELIMPYMLQNLEDDHG